MKGIILAGGKATRLYPITKGICKQLLPVYDKPMVYYPMSVLMLAGIKDILIISTPQDLSHFEQIFGNGSRLGIQIKYAAQPKPEGIAQSFLIGEKFIGKNPVCLVLGDNIFYGDRLSAQLEKAAHLGEGAQVFGYKVKDPERYGVLTFDKTHKVTSITEKPKKAKSSWVVTGLYFLDAQCVQMAKNQKVSKRGELEITDLLEKYRKKNQLDVHLLGRGNAWLDTGTYESLLEASHFIKIIEERQDVKIGCVEEIAYSMSYINKNELLSIAREYPASYGDYLRQLTK